MHWTRNSVADFRVLAWLRWRQWRSSALYWLRTLGYDPARQNFIDRLYALYLLLFGLVWIVVAGLAAVSQAAALGRGLPPAAAEAFLSSMPWLVVGLAVLLLIRALRSSPLLLSFPDMAYVAASPVSRAAFAMVNFGQACIQYWVIVLPVAALLVVVASQPLGQPVARWAALRAAAAGAPVIPLLLSLAWLGGLLRLDRRERRGSSLWWWAALLLVPLAWLLPPLRWPGEAIGAAIRGPFPAGTVVLLWAVAALAVAALGYVSQKISLIAAAEESRTYARLNALGLMAILAPDVAKQIRRQESLARRGARLALPRGEGLMALAARSMLLSLRRPLTLVQLALWMSGAVITAAWLVLGKAPLTLWFFWVSFLVWVPPKMLAEAFGSDTAEPYLRQLLPMGNGALALAGGSTPLLVALLGGGIGWIVAALQHQLTPAGWVFGAGLVVCGVLVLLLAQAAAHARVGFLGWRPPYAGWLLIVVALIGGAILATGPVPGAILGAGLALLLLGAAVGASQPIAVD